MSTDVTAPEEPITRDTTAEAWFTYDNYDHLAWK